MVEDTNDHCPVLVKMPQTMCMDHNVIYVTAMDNDLEPNGPPFVFTIVPGSTKEALMVEQINGEDASVDVFGVCLLDDGWAVEGRWWT